METVTKDYVRLKVVWKLKDFQKDLATMMKVADSLESGKLTEDQVIQVLEKGDISAQEATAKIAKLKKDIETFLRRNK